MSICFGPSAWPATSPVLTPLRYLPCGTQRTRSIGKTAAASYGVCWRRQGIRWSCEEDDRSRIVHVEWRRALWTETDWTDGFVPCWHRLASFSVVGLLSDMQLHTGGGLIAAKFCGDIGHVVQYIKYTWLYCNYTRTLYCTIFGYSHVRTLQCW